MSDVIFQHYDPTEHFAQSLFEGTTPDTEFSVTLWYGQTTQYIQLSRDSLYGLDDVIEQICKEEGITLRSLRLAIEGFTVEGEAILQLCGALRRVADWVASDDVVLLEVEPAPAPQNEAAGAENLTGKDAVANDDDPHETAEPDVSNPPTTGADTTDDPVTQTDDIPLQDDAPTPQPKQDIASDFAAAPTPAQMDLRAFFSAVVPWQGGGFNSIHWKGAETNFRGRSFASLDQLLIGIATQITICERDRLELYFCLSLQLLSGGKRDREHARALQALFLDVDFKEHYKSPIDAAVAVWRFCIGLGIPRPSAIIFTGGGLHVYWFSDRPLTVAEWQPYADGLKIAATNAGLKADLGVTGDAARVLRVPGTKNYKYDPPREVRFIQPACAGRRLNFQTELAKLVDLATNAGGSNKKASGERIDEPVAAQVADAFRHLDATKNLGEGIESTAWFEQLAPEQKDEVVDHALACIARNSKLLELEENGGNNNEWYRLTAAVVRSKAPNAENIFVKHASTAKDADPEEALRRKFVSCQKSNHPKAGGISVGTLLHLARENGADFRPWKRLAEDKKPATIDWAKVKQPGWLNSAADLPDDIPYNVRRIIEHTGTLEDLNNDLIARGELSNPYNSWSEVTLALIASLKSYGYTAEEIAEALLANLPCNQYITGQKNRHRAVERAIARSHDPKKLIIAGVKFRDGDRYGKAKPSLANAVIAIRVLGIGVSHDLFHHRINVTYNGDSKTIVEGLLTDDTISAVRSLINNTYSIDCGDNFTLAAIKEVARDNAYDPVLDMLNECQSRWDGVKRLNTWTSVYLDCEDTPLNRAIGWLTLVAACRRARVPGCKFDQITVLEGLEGKDKSTAIRVLAGDENFSDQSILGASEKEVQEQLQGIWMHENADLDGMRRAEVTKVKNFASRQVDRARPAYGRVREDRPRRSIEWGTTNEETYLLSQTGNRRFWSLKIGKIDIAALKRDREQLLGEAATYEAASESIVLDEKLWDAARGAQELRRVIDPWEDILANMPDEVIRKSGDGFERVASAELLERVLSIQKAQQTSTHSQRLALAMKQIGWKRNESGLVMIDGKSMRGYIRPATGGDEQEIKNESYSQQGWVRFLNHYIRANTLYTDHTNSSESIAVHRHPERGRSIYIQAVRDERKILISRTALVDYLRKEKLQANEVVEGLIKSFGAKERRLALGAGTPHAQAQEAIIELSVPVGSPLDDLMSAYGTYTDFENSDG